MKKTSRGRPKTGRKKRPDRTHKNDQRTTTPTATSEQSVVTKSATRQTTAYLKKLFSEVGFSIDSKKGQNFLVDLNLLDLLERTADILKTPKPLLHEKNQAKFNFYVFQCI